MVESTQNNTRAEIKAAVKAFAEEHLAGFDGYEHVDTFEKTYTVDG